MSTLNLLQLDDLDRRSREIPERDDSLDSGQPKPQPRPRKVRQTFASSPNPDPDRHQKLGRDTDDVISVSSSSSERVRHFEADNLSFTMDAELPTSIASNSPMRTNVSKGDVSSDSSGSVKPSRRRKLGKGDQENVKSYAVQKTKVKGILNPDKTSIETTSKEASSSPKKLTKNAVQDEYLAVAIGEPNVSEETYPELQAEESEQDTSKLKPSFLSRFRKSTRNFFGKSSTLTSSMSSQDFPLEEPLPIVKEKPVTSTGFAKRKPFSIKAESQITFEDESVKAHGPLQGVVEEEIIQTELLKSESKVEERNLGKDYKKETQKSKWTEWKKTKTEKLKVVETKQAEKPSMTDKVISEARRKSHHRRKQILKARDSAVENQAFLGVTVHNTDSLPMDPNVLHPVVKVTIMDESGQYLSRFHYSQLESVKKHSRKSRLGDIADSHESRRKSSKLTRLRSESILPILTQPCQMSSGFSSFAPTWNELLLFEEPFERLLEEDYNAMFFFELMDFLPMAGMNSSSFRFHGSEAGWYKVAWGFLKPIGKRCSHLNKKVRLQLYKPVSLKVKDNGQGQDPEVYNWWKSNRRDKINASLYVTVKGIHPFQQGFPGLKELLHLKDEQSFPSEMDNKKLSHTKHRPVDSEKQGHENNWKYPNWTRLEGQSCKVPNKMAMTLPSTQIDSLNLIISGNVHCVRFSPCGCKLAVGFDMDEIYSVLVFEIPSGNLVRSLRGHHGVIYDLSWKFFEVDNKSTVHFLASASADCTALIWKMDNNMENSLRVVKALLHPSFVYCVTFHPTHPSIVATGCYDYIIRIWDVQTDGHDRYNGIYKGPNHDSAPIFLLDRHESFVNCTTFDLGGYHLFSGDGSGTLLKFSMKSPSRKKSWKIDRNIKFSDSGKQPINSVCCHPGGSRLLVHVRANSIFIVDIENFVVLQTFWGVQNDKLQIGSCFSPCGNLVLSGSEDATLCIWDTDTGSILKFITPDNHWNCAVTCVDYHPFDHYVVVGVASTVGESSPIILYTYELPRTGKQKSTLKMKGSSRNSPSRGDASHKFRCIIEKLDVVLQVTKNRDQKQSKPPTGIVPELSLTHIDHGQMIASTSNSNSPFHAMAVEHPNNSIKTHPEESRIHNIEQEQEGKMAEITYENKFLEQLNGEMKCDAEDKITDSNTAIHQLEDNHETPTTKNNSHISKTVIFNSDNINVSPPKAKPRGILNSSTEKQATLEGMNRSGGITPEDKQNPMSPIRDEDEFLEPERDM